MSLFKEKPKFVSMVDILSTSESILNNTKDIPTNNKKDKVLEEDLNKKSNNPPTNNISKLKSKKRIILGNAFENINLTWNI